MKKTLVIGLSLITSSLLYGGFDFGGNSGGCEGGNNTFKQEIHKDKTIAIPGTIPKGIKNLNIQLKSDKDLDIQLYDKENGTAIIKWASSSQNAGILSGAGKDTTSYQNMNITWSGYNGDGTGLGNEYIKINGETKKELTMKVYGFKAGFANVNYSWDKQENCNDSSTPSASGSDSFEQQILYKQVIEVKGTIPPGIDNLYISLKSDKDVDVQLFDKDSGKALVGWNINALIGDGAGYAKTPYKGMIIEYSGYNGVNNKQGHEYIKLTGKTTTNLIMKAYGFKAGYAKIDYKWGKVTKLKGIKFIDAKPASGKSYAEVGENITFRAGTYSSDDGKIKVYIQYHTGVDYLPKEKMTKQSSILWTATRALKAGKEKKYKIIVEGLDGTVIDTQVKSIEVKENVLTASTLSFPCDVSGNKWSHTSGSSFHKVINYADNKFNDTYALDLNLNSPSHNSDKGKIVKPIADGKIIINNNYGLGFILIKHDTPLKLDNGTQYNTWYSGYMHMNNKISKETDDVTKGDKIGNISHVGANNDHLHFAIYTLVNGRYQSLDIKNNLSSFVTPITGWY